MRSTGWLAIAMAMVLAVTLCTASCSKKVVQTQAVSTTEPEVRKAEVRKAEVRKAEVQKADVQKAEVQKAPDRATEKAGQPGRPEDYRLWAEAAAREAAARAFLKEHIHFAFNSALLSDEARQILNGKAEYLRTNPGIAVTMEGHCDDRGTDAYNMALGDRRAESVKTFLVGLGIGTNRLSTVSYGKERPIAKGHDEASWAKNRRVQFLINRVPEDRMSFKD